MMNQTEATHLIPSKGGARYTKDVTLVDRDSITPIQKDLLSNIHAGDVGNILRLVASNPEGIRNTCFIVLGRSGKSYALPFLHFVILCASTGDIFSVAHVQSIVKSLNKKNHVKDHDMYTLLDTIAQWECPSGGQPIEVSALHMAAIFRSVDIAKALLSAGASINLQNSAGLTPLHLTVSSGEENPDVLSVFLKLGADPNKTDVYGWTVLHRAIDEGCSSEIIHLLTNTGHANVNARINKTLSTPLFQAVQLGDIDLASRLLDAGADIHHRTYKKETVMHFAVANGNPALVKLVLQAGGSPLTNIPNYRGITPLMEAIQAHNMAIVHELLENGYPCLEFTNISGQTVWDVALDERDEAILIKMLDKHCLTLIGKTIEDKTVPVAPLSPLQVATRRSDPNEVKLLLKLGVWLEEREVGSLNTFLHTATAANCHSILAEDWIEYTSLLLTKNRNLDTVFHLALRDGDLKTIEILFEKVDPALLQSILQSINRQHYSPLHVCCNRADPDVAQLTIETIKTKLVQQSEHVGLAGCSDLQGNSYLHLAARNQLSEFCKELLTLNADGNMENHYGNTPLHEAVLSGHLDTVQVFLNNGKDVCNKGKCNKKGRTILHCAALSNKVSPTLLSMASTSVKLVSTSKGVDLLNAIDENGNTALHLLLSRAGMKELYLCIAALTGCNFYIVNAKGDTPLHTSAMNRDPLMFSTAIQVLKTRNLPLPVNVENGDGKTLFMLCMESGHQGALGALVEAGSDLSYRSGAPGDTPLHHLVRLSVQQLGLRHRWSYLYADICELAVDWWCKKHDIVEPELGNKHHKQLKAMVLKYLTSALRNDGAGNAVKPLELSQSSERCPMDPLLPDEGPGHTVLQLASLQGAAPMLEVILSTPDVYRMTDQHQGHIITKYDVTFLTPDSSLLNGRKAAVSCFELLSLSPERLVVPFLGINPLQDLARVYWKRYQWLFVLLMMLHIAYMAVFCYVGLRMHHVPSQNLVCETDYVVGSPGLHDIVEICMTSEVPDVATPGLHAMLLIWPVLIGVYQTWYILRRCRRHAGARSMAQEWQMANDFPSGGFSYGFRLFHKEITNLASIVFCLLVVLWYIFLAFRSIVEVYFMSLAFGVGWLLTINFARGFETINSFSTMIKYVIIKDIIRFMFFFVFIFLGFSFAQHAMFLHSPTYVQEHPTLMYTFFYVFQMMLSIADPFSADYDHDLYEAGIDVSFTKVIYVIFMILTAIILLNILIAMITDTYVNLKAVQVTQWRLDNLKLAIDLEKNLSRLKYVLRSPCRTTMGIVKERTTIHPRSKYGSSVYLSTERYYFTPSKADMSACVQEAHDTAFMQRLDNLEQSLQDIKGLLNEKKLEGDSSVATSSTE